uniref:Uncharacterized protein n=1 Tax=Arundo donax TaxID=35708 RepID=A0A0A8YAP3_ARUDO
MISQGVVCGHLVFLSRKCRRVRGRVLEDHGSSLASCHFLTPLDMTAQRPS